MSRDFCRFLVVLSLAGLTGTVAVPAQDEPAEGSPAASGQTEPAATPDDEKDGLGPISEAPDESVSRWDRLIYVPFRELQKVFDKQDASVVLPYHTYMELMKNYLNAAKTGNGQSPDAVITASRYTAKVEKDIVRITVQLQVNVMKERGWAAVPLSFGQAAVGSVSGTDDRVLLQGVGPGAYQLLLEGSGNRTVTLELLATIRTSPENRSFQIQCPAAGISDLVITIPEADQAVTISPVQVLLPTEGDVPEGSTVVRASLGATDQFEVRWNARAGTKPVMDLLTSVSNTSETRIEPGLVQTRTVLNYEILRGELREVTVLAPADSRIVDVTSSSGRIRAWNAVAVGDTHQQVRIELLSPVTDRLQVELQTERGMTADTVQLVGRSADGRVQGVHADGVVRESGRVILTTDPSLTTVVKLQSGVKQVDAGSGSKGATAEARQAWEFSGLSGQLVLQTKPVEPRLLVNHDVQLIFSDDELRVRSELKYTVERAGVFQLVLTVPAALIVDRVSADGMSEFNVDKDSGRITLSLAQKRMGDIGVTVLAHQPFDAAAENRETELPTVTPEGVERETGTVTLYAPQFLDVSTVEDKLVGLFPARDVQVQPHARLRHIGTWSFTRRPVALFVQTSPRPAQLAAAVGTTARVEPEIVKLNSVVSFDIQNAGIDTFRIAVPEAVASDVRFQAVSPGHAIQQRTKAEQAEDGWVTWTLVLQEEAMGNVRIAVDWEVTPAAATAAVATPSVAGGQAVAANSAGATGSAPAGDRSFVLQPPRVLLPFTADQAERRRVTLTQTRGEIRLLRHESLSITAVGQGDTMESVDVRELELLEQDGYLAFRYFSQPASANVQIRRHDIHEVVATVVSRASVEIVTEKQELASFRCRFRVTTSERQRLRVDLPAGSELQAPLLNGQRTTVERATDVEETEGWEAYYVSISREQTSDQDFLLTLQFRCPIVAAGQITYDRYGGIQILRLPLPGTADGSTVLQQMRLAVWAPKDVAFIGDPQHWTQIGRPYFSWLRLYDSPSSLTAAAELNDWIGDTSGGAGDFATVGNVAVFRAVGRQEQIEAHWRNRPFLFWLISGTLVLVGLILKGTSWENRISIVLLAAFAVSLWALQDGYAALQYVTAAVPGLLIVAGLWVTGLLLGRSDRHGGIQVTAADRNSPGPAGYRAAAGAASSSGGASGAVVATFPVEPPAATEQVPAVSPSPEVTQWMNDLMGGK